MRGFQPGHVHQYEAADAHFPRQNVHLPDPLPEFFDARMPQPWFLSVKVGTGVVLLVVSFGIGVVMVCLYMHG